MPAATPEDRAKAYTASGVNLNSGYELVRRIKGLVKSTRTDGVLSDIGGFGGLFMPDISGMKNPVLVSGTDGVGTKLKLAFTWHYHSSIGIDLVAMSVNDILVQGATPLFFLDYFACGKLDVGVAEQVISGVAEGCRQSKCALLGGETAEMPGMYAEGEYDLAGFCVGMADQEKLIDGSGIKNGDAVIGLASSGAHSNGYSLIRKILKKSGLEAQAPFPGLPDKTIRDVTLCPTRIYAGAVELVLNKFTIRGMAHITGGGFFENIPRALPGDMMVSINFNAWNKSPLFYWLKDTGDLSWPEMLQIFNCGIGFVMMLPQDEAPGLLDTLHSAGQEAWQIGKVSKRAGNAEQVSITF